MRRFSGPGIPLSFVVTAFLQAFLEDLPAPTNIETDLEA
jgi:hypothetical protein